VQIVVEYADHQFRYFPVKDCWRVDPAFRCIVIGRGLPRTYVPLDSVRNFTVETLTSSEETT
jgi:hypothetical protein